MLEDWGEMFQLQLVLWGQYMLQSGIAMLHSVTALHKIAILQIPDDKNGVLTAHSCQQE